MAQAELASLGLTQQQLDALNELFWTRNRGAIGVRQLWEQLRDHPQQKAALAASDGREGWISWRQLRRWYALWEAPQLMRRAPAVSKTRGALPRALVENVQQLGWDDESAAGAPRDQRRLLALFRRRGVAAGAGVDEAGARAGRGAECDGRWSDARHAEHTMAWAVLLSHFLRRYYV